MRQLNKIMHGDLFKDIAWTVIGQIFIMIVLMIINKVLSNNLSVDEFGKFNLIKRSASVLSFIMLGGAGITLPRFLPIYIVKKRWLSARNTIVSIGIYIAVIIFVTTIICLVCYRQFGAIICGDGEFVPTTIVLSYSIVLALTGILLAYFRAIGKFKKYSQLQVLMQTVLILPLFFINNLGVFGLYVAWTLINVLVIIYIGYLEFRKYKIIYKRKIRNISNILKSIFIYSLPRLIGDFFLFSLSAFPLLYIAKEGTLAEVSYFSVGNTFVNIMSTVFSFLGVILLPRVSTALAENRINQAKSLISKLSIIYFAGAIVLVTIFYSFAAVIIQFFFSEQYLGSTSITRIQILAVIPNSIYLLYRNPLDAVYVFPFNALILAFCFVLMIVLFSVSTTLEDYAYSYLTVILLQGLSSFIVWNSNNKLK